MGDNKTLVVSGVFTLEMYMRLKWIAVMKEQKQMEVK